MSRTILLADDSLTIQRVVELTFVDEDYQVVSVGSGDDAIAHIERDRPDIVIADAHLPGLSGYELARQAKELDGSTPVLLLVGTFETVDDEELSKSGADRHLKKPFDSHELFKTVEELVTGDGGGAEAEPSDAPVETVAVDLSEVEVSADDSAPAYETVVSPTADLGVAEDTPPDAATTQAFSLNSPLSDEDVEKVARKVAEILGPSAVEGVAWDVIPDLAEVVIKERIRELESQVE